MVASKTVIVHDAALNIDRQIIAGQDVPPDLLDAYQAATGENVDEAKAKAEANSPVEHVTAKTEADSPVEPAARRRKSSTAE